MISLLEMDDYPVKSTWFTGAAEIISCMHLKLAKFDYIKRKAGFSPILLLDDIFDKFDADRVEQIIRLVGNNSGSGRYLLLILILHRLEDILSSHNSEYKLFSIENNKVS